MIGLRDRTWPHLALILRDPAYRIRRGDLGDHAPYIQIRFGERRFQCCTVEAEAGEAWVWARFSGSHVEHMIRREDLRRVYV